MPTPRSKVISMRLSAASDERLQRLARRHGWTPSDASARLVEEGLRRAEFAFIDFRDSPVGRQACIQGSTLAVWEVLLVARAHHHRPQTVARHLGWPVAKVQAALNYADAFPEEIDAALADNDALNLMSLRRQLPQISEFTAASRGHAQAPAR